MQTPPPNGVRAFALVAGIEAVVRGTTLSVYPLVMYRAWGNAALVSEIYFAIGLLSLLTALTVPTLTQYVSRHAVYTTAIVLYGVSAGFGMVGGKVTTLALLCGVMAAATALVCFNAYVLDQVDRTEFGQLETRKLLYGGVGWVLGPVLGVWLFSMWEPAPFFLVGLGAVAMLMVTQKMRLGNGKAIVRRTHRASHPVANVIRFFAQPRLFTAWLIPLIRSCAWWVFFVYVGIYAVESGLGERVGGVATSIAMLGLFLSPLMLRWSQRHSVRKAIRAGCMISGVCFLGAAALSGLPWVMLVVLVLGSYGLVLLDTCAGLPFLMSVKPSERTEMSAVYSSFRDASGILSPGLAWLVLQFSPVAGVFAAAGLLLLGGWVAAGHLHPQLGVPGAQRVRLNKEFP
jgi:ACDE family multidrug resistance protein